MESSKKVNNEKLSMIHQFSTQHNLSWPMKLNLDSLYVELPQQFCEGSKEKLVSLLEFAGDELHCTYVVVYFDKTRPDRALVVKTFMFLGFRVLSPENTLMEKVDKQLDKISMVYIVDGDD